VPACERAHDIANLGPRGRDAAARIHNEMRPRPLLRIGQLPRQDLLETLRTHSLTRQNTFALHRFRRADHDDGVAMALAPGLEKQRNVENGDGGAGSARPREEAIAPRRHQRMYDRLESLHRGIVTDHMLAEQRPVDAPLACRAGKGGLDGSNGFRAIEIMHCGIRIMDGAAGFAKQIRRGGFAHADRTGEAEHEGHHLILCRLQCRPQPRLAAQA